MGTRDVERRLRWFEVGAEALARVCPDYPGRYACPICLRVFERTAVEAKRLTDEHVPPRSVNGRKLVLTCRSCNNLAGRRFDRHMRTMRRLMSLGTAAPESVNATLTIDGIPNRGSLRLGSEHVEMYGVDAQNNPAEVELIKTALDTWGPGTTFSLQISERCDEPSARLGWLRAAYLAAFAHFGYRYIGQSEFDIVRTALTSTDALPLCVPLHHGSASPSERPLIGIVSAPSELSDCVAVLFQRELIFLPPLMNGGGFFQRYGTLHAAGAFGAPLPRLTIGHLTPLTSRPLHAMDG